MRPGRLRAQLKEAYRRLLNPLIRILIRNGVSATETIDLVRRVYIDAATSDEFQLPSRRISATRIAILTGLTRKEVNRLSSESGEKELGTNLNRITRLIAAWNQDPFFTGPYGMPLAIPYEGRPGAETPSFVELVRRHSDDISAKAMLDELIRTGLAHLDEDGLIRNSGRSYIPSKLDPAALERFGKTVGRLIDTLDFNNELTGTTLGRFERAVTTDIGLTEEQYREFNVYLRGQCQQLLETLDNWLATQEGRLNAYQDSEQHGVKRLTTGVGVYHFLDDEGLESLWSAENSSFEDEDDV